MFRRSVHTPAAVSATLLPRLALLGAASLLGAAALELVSPPAGQAVAPAAPIGATAAAPTAARVAPDYGIIASAHLFGVYDPNAATAAAEQEIAVIEPAQEAAVESTLQLNVTGIVYADDGAARAMLSGPGLDGEAAFAVGDTVVDGVAIEAIEPYRVLIRNHGRLEAIELPGAELPVTAAPAAPAPGRAPREVVSAAFGKP